MKYDLFDSPDFAGVKLTFEQAGESVRAESGAMLARDTGVEMQTSMQGGFFSAAKRSLLGGESFFMNTFTATAPGQTLWLAPAAEGDMLARQLQGDVLFAQAGAFVAAQGDVTVDTKFQGLKGFFSGESLFFLRLSGSGLVLLSAYGGLQRIEVGDEGYVVDTGHVVAFTEGLEYRVRPFGGMKGLFFSGEGLVCEFHGRGDLWIQTRNPQSLSSFLYPFRPAPASSSSGE